MSKRGRPRKEIDKRLFENLCIIQCTLNEICSVLDCNNKTLETWCKREYGRNFSEVFSQIRSRGFASLRRAMYRKAVEKGDTRMMIYLANNWLDMNEKKEVKVNGEIGATTLAELMMKEYQPKKI